MAITINNSIANILGTPGAISGVFVDRPAAANQAEGTLYFANDTLEIYQVVAGSWSKYSGGGGGTNPTSTYLPYNNAGSFADSFLNQSSNVLKSTYASNDIGLYFDFANQICQIGNYSSDIRFGLKIDGNFGNIYLGDYEGIVNPSPYLFIGDDGISFNVIKTKIDSNDIGLKLDFVNNVYSIGDFNNINSGAKFIIDDINQYIYTSHYNKSSNFVTNYGIYINFQENDNYSVILGDVDLNYDGARFIIDNNGSERFITASYGIEVGLLININQDTYYLGDPNQLTNGNFFVVNNDNNQIYSGKYISGSRKIFGTYVDTNLFITTIGDYFNNFNHTYIGINDASQKLIISGNLLTTSMGSISSQHLKVNIGGVDYVIELRNP